MSQFCIKDYGGIHCLYASADGLKVAVSIDVGPRVLYFGRESNLLHIEPQFFFKRHCKKHVPYGGHRLWIAPESEKSYDLDSYGVSYGTSLSSCPEEFRKHIHKERGEFAWFLHEDNVSQTEKLMAVTLNKDGLKIEQVIKNIGEERELSLWGITQFPIGGFCVLPQSAEQTGLLFNRVMSAWAYTDLTDPRVFIGKHYVTMSGTEQKEWNAIKFGLNATRGKIAYVKDGTAVIISSPYLDGKYPDGGCNAESYACARFVEAEVLSPLYKLKKGECAKLTQYLTVKTGVGSDARDESELDKLFL